MRVKWYTCQNLFTPNGVKSISYCYPVRAGEEIAHGYQNGKDWGTHQQHFEQAGGGPYWNLKANGGLEASLNDMYTWINSITNHKVLQDSSIAQMFTPHIQEDGYNGRSSFGYGCNISKSRRNTVVIDNGGSNGIYFARLIRFPEEKLVFYMVTNESSMNTNMVLPNVSQMYFTGAISQDATNGGTKFNTPQSKAIYELLTKNKTTNLAQELDKAGISVDDDMILLEVGEKLISEHKPDEALVLYKFYTTKFPKIIVAWNDLGDVYQMKNDKKAAISCYQQALKLRPGNPRAIDNLKKLSGQ